MEDKKTSFSDFEKLDPTEATLYIVELMKDIVVEDQNASVETKQKILLLFLQYQYYHKQLEVISEIAGIIKKLSEDS